MIKKLATKPEQEELEKVRKQFSDSEWEILWGSPEFQDCWERREIIRAQEVANRVLRGNFKDPKAARLSRTAAAKLRQKEAEHGLKLAEAERLLEILKQ